MKYTISKHSMPGMTINGRLAPWLVKHRLGLNVTHRYFDSYSTALAWTLAHAGLAPTVPTN